MLAPQTQWVQGTSTNFGSDTRANPDYVFEQGNVPGSNQALNTTLAAPQNGGLSIATQDFVTGPQQVTVSSRDFGGAGQLRATARLQDGTVYDNDVVDQNGVNVVVPSGACGATFGQHQFASIPVDQDCDGISDSWRLRYFGTVNNILSLANADADGDGADNLHEFKAGTNPNDASSVLRVATKNGLAPDVGVQWPSVLNKQYVIERSTSLYSPTWTSISTNTGTGWDMEFHDANGGNVRFYRVRVLP